MRYGAEAKEHSQPGLVAKFQSRTLVLLDNTKLGAFKQGTEYEVSTRHCKRAQRSQVSRGVSIPGSIAGTSLG